MFNWIKRWNIIFEGNIFSYALDQKSLGIDLEWPEHVWWRIIHGRMWYLCSMSMVALNISILKGLWWKIRINLPENSSYSVWKTITSIWLKSKMKCVQIICTDCMRKKSKRTKRWNCLQYACRCCSMHQWIEKLVVELNASKYSMAKTYFFNSPVIDV